MRTDRVLTTAAMIGMACSVAQGSAILDIRRAGGQLLESVPAHQSVTVELWLTNLLATTTQLSAYQFNFQAGDFVSGRLQASNWSQGVIFDGLTPAWISLDQSLNTSANNFTVAGLSGSLSTPFVGPILPLNTPVFMATFNVMVNADAGGFVDFVLASQSGIDDQNGNLGGGGLSQFSLAHVSVVPEPNGVIPLVATLIGVYWRRRRQRRRRSFNIREYGR